MTFPVPLIVGEVYKDARDDLFMWIGTADPDYPWRYLNPLAEGGIAEPRDEGFPRRPLRRARFDDEEHDGGDLP